MQAIQLQRYPDDAARWQAVLERDPGADGVFYYAVRSTGIYCRPICPARRPRREQVAFFPSPEAAKQSGFRACRRCQPGEVSREQQVVARMQQLLDGNEPAPTLQTMAEDVGLSPFHLHRVFRRVTGLTPRAYAAARRAERLKQELRSGSTVTEALYDAGYGSSRALYDGATARLGMNPGTYRRGGAGERIGYSIVDSPLGRVLVAATVKGVCAVRFGRDDELVNGLRAEFPNAELTEDAGLVDGYVREIRGVLDGQVGRTSVPLDARGTAFQQRVWAALREIPTGETRSYRQVAEAIGQPTAVRAVARACAANPVALLVPCHRVIRTDGAPGGYRWGMERKQALLEQERNHGELLLDRVANPL
jgi:AraC family transcriptional regulator, regulatory protein of adaptative response / methylated-DNA-[protein]-cysteine methyltransferase